MIRNRLPLFTATAALAGLGMLGIAPAASAAPAAPQASACVNALTAAQTSNNAAIDADGNGDTDAAAQANQSTEGALVRAAVNCLVGQSRQVTADVVKALVNNTDALLANFAGDDAEALAAEQEVASALTDALGIAH